MITDPKVLKRIIELTAELEELLQVSTTFLYGEGDTDIRGVLLADLETTEIIFGGLSGEDLN